MQVEAWHITGNGFHLGRHGLGQEESGVHFPSDSLFAAMVARLAELKGADDVASFVAKMRDDLPPFVISSAFPRAGNVLFFPTPLARSSGDLPTGVKPKELKKAKFVSQEIFMAMLKGESLMNFTERAIKLNDGKAWALPEENLPEQVVEDEGLWSVERRPRVAVGRADNRSQIYFTGRTVFHQECGMWFGIRWLNGDDETKALFETLMRDLGAAGLGGERSSGFGKCEIEKKSELALDDPKGLWMTLSRYLPKEEEMNGFNIRAAYAIETVGGWVYSSAEKNQRRKPVRMLTEGSVFGSVGRDAPGQIADATPKYGSNKQPMFHKVWRCGLALAVGITLKDGRSA
ncbi:MAG: type III-A CRISPR-associated RAMP protein Csm4 [Chloroflexi bacterium]|nr:type III-A CRISPR-associated RAMP protein Csm4 [Chloroflexota bacterium]